MQHTFIQKLPNRLTWLRIGCIPIVVLLMLRSETVEPNAVFVPSEADYWSAAVFVVAAITDFFDGWIARRYGVETVLGKLLDPLADKLLVVSALIILVDKHRLAGWIAVIVIVRDLGINAIRIAAMEENITVASSWIGKTKTALLYAGIVGLMLYGSVGWFSFRFVGEMFMWCALIASVTSAILYLIDYARQLRKVGSGLP